MNGFRSELINKIVGFNSHVTVEPYENSINVEKLNPYGVVYIKELLLTVKGEEKTVLRFTVDADGKITEINDLPYQIVKSISSFEGER